MLRSYRDQALVLRSHKLGEADRIVILLGRDTGQIRAVAKGVRRTTSRFGARLDAFNLVDIQLHKGRNLDTVSQVDLLTGYSAPLGQDYEAFTSAKVMVETIQKLTDGMGETDPAYFRLLHGALGVLSKHKYPNSLITSSFLLRVMTESGWTPILDICSTCQQTENLTLFSADLGGSVCPDCASLGAVSLSLSGRHLMRALLDGNWDAAIGLPIGSREEVATAAATWTQWHLEQRLRSLPFLSLRN